jgi:ketosteroid isomerase-like protein
MINDGAAVANAYDSFMGATKEGKPVTLHGRTTLVFVKEAGQWKVCSAHFSPLPAGH